MQERLKDFISSAYDPDDLVNALEIDIDDLIEVLWNDILEKREQLGFTDEPQENDNDEY